MTPKDGITFTELSFSEEYRKRSTASQGSYTYSRSEQQEGAMGLPEHLHRDPDQLDASQCRQVGA